MCLSSKANNLMPQKEAAKIILENKLLDTL
jgi:hypothetical protein